MKKTNFKCMYLVDDFLYNKVVKDNPKHSTDQNKFKEKFENLRQNKPTLNSFSNTTNTVSTPSLVLNSETEPTTLPSLPTSPTPNKSPLEPISPSNDCDCSDPNKSSSIINKKNCS